MANDEQPYNNAARTRYIFGTSSEDAAMLHGHMCVTWPVASRYK